MQDVTDLAFMRALERLGSLPDCFVTPYFRSTATTCAMGDANLRVLRENATGVPVWAQLAGSDPSALARDARALLAEFGSAVAGIDLNAGCPSPLVNRHGAGAALLRGEGTPALRAAMAALRETVPPGRFSVKCRLGWAEASEFTGVLEALREASPDRVAVHVRTRKELYRSDALHRERVAEAVRALDCPVLANGDIATAEDARLWASASGCAGVMIGRGAVRNPYIFRELRGGPPATSDDLRAYYAILLEETARILVRPGERSHCNRMKKYLAFCYPDFTPDQEYRLRRCTSVAAMARLLASGGVQRRG